MRAALQRLAHTGCPVLEYPEQFVRDHLSAVCTAWRTRAGESAAVCLQRRVPANPVRTNRRGTRRPEAHSLLQVGFSALATRALSAEGSRGVGTAARQTQALGTGPVAPRPHLVHVMRHPLANCTPLYQAGLRIFQQDFAFQLPTARLPAWNVSTVGAPGPAQPALARGSVPSTLEATAAHSALASSNQPAAARSDHMASTRKPARVASRPCEWQTMAPITQSGSLSASSCELSSGGDS